MRKRAKHISGGASSARDELPTDVSKLSGWRPARVIADATATKVPTRRVTINLDADIVAVFKADALRGGPPYQVAINQALRAYLRDREAIHAVETVLRALDDERVQDKLRKVVGR